jgi:hypothetical protein
MTADYKKTIPYVPQKIVFENVAGETFGIFTKNGIELENGSIVPPEKIDFFITYISRNGKKVRYEDLNNDTHNKNN